MLLGKTGAGKTTMLDALSNYLLGVNMFDNFRYRVVTPGNGNQAESQTRDTVLYHIPSSLIKNRIFKDVCCITFVDSPGYGDTGGLEEDQRTKMMLHHLLTTLTKIDYVFLVAKSDEQRIDAFTKNVYDEITQLYAKDVIPRIIATITHSQGPRANVLTAFKDPSINIKIDDRYFLFNNNAIFQDRNKLTDK